jgi:hypothetical protein
VTISGRTRVCAHGAEGYELIVCGWIVGNSYLGITSGSHRQALQVE